MGGAGKAEGRVFSMIMAIVGSMGSGKTLTMTYFAYKEHLKGVKVISNYKMEFPHTLISKKEVVDYGSGKSVLSDCVLCLDEAQTLLDCRTSQKNRIITYFILQTRKRGVNLFYTTQQFWNVEKRLRENTDIIIECEPIFKPEKKGSLRQLEAIRLHFFRYGGRNSFEPLKKVLLPNPSAVYALYNSYEIVDFDKA